MSENYLHGSILLSKIYPEITACGKGGFMKVSAISHNSANENIRRNSFINFSNSFMSAPEGTNPVEQAEKANRKSAKLGIENLQEFTIFPRQVIDGKTVITA